MEPRVGLEPTTFSLRMKCLMLYIVLVFSNFNVCNIVFCIVFVLKRAL